MSLVLLRGEGGARRLVHWCYMSPPLQLLRSRRRFGVMLASATRGRCGPAVSLVLMVFLHRVSTTTSLLCVNTRRSKLVFVFVFFTLRVDRTNRLGLDLSGVTEAVCLESRICTLKEMVLLAGLAVLPSNLNPVVYLLLEPLSWRRPFHLTVDERRESHVFFEL